MDNRFAIGCQLDGATTPIPQYSAVIQDTAEGCAKLPTAANQRVLGFVDELINKDNKSASVITKGEYFGIAGETISIGDLLNVHSSNGRLKKAVAKLTTALAGANNDLVWTALAQGAAGDLITLEYRNPAAGTADTLTTALAGNNNDLVFTAKTAYFGTLITVEYVDPFATEAIKGAVEHVTVAGGGITVHLATDAGTGAITSTGDTIKATIAAHTLANAMVSVADAGGNDGTGVVIAMAATPLTGGSGLPDEGISATERIEVAGTAIIVHLATDAAGAITSTADTIKATLAAHTVAAALVSAVDAGADDGSGTVIAMDPTPLSGGGNVCAIARQAGTTGYAFAISVEKE